MAKTRKTRETQAAQQIQNEQTAPCVLAPKHDTRFNAPEWQKFPFNLIYKNFLLTQHWWMNVTTAVDGMSRRDGKVVSFAARQILETMSPANLLWTNPEVIAKTKEEGGGNLIRGTKNLVEDWERTVSGKPPVGVEDFLPGRDVAVTPGKVVFRTHLLELIQYAPQTETVATEPLLIVPAWALKYYILDLSPHNSLVSFFVKQGFTVFMISWRNPDAEDRNLGMSDYLGALGEALDCVGGIVPDTPIHTVGYCLGGTLLSIKAAQMAHDRDERLKTLTLFAAQTDFEDPGALQLFLNESTVSSLEHLMSEQGYLDTKQMVDAVKVLQSEDSIWQGYIHSYLMGTRQKMVDQDAWSADSTRMPYRMYSDYLRRIVLNNELAQGHYEVDDKPVAISDISVPILCVATVDDIVAPWPSVYKLHLLTNTDITFVLTSGDHVDGIVRSPDEGGSSYQIAPTPDRSHPVASGEWRAQTPLQDGPWWPELVTWLRGHSSGTTKPPQMGGAKLRSAALIDAPGTYVFQR